MTEQAGHLNAPDLVEECARAIEVALDGAARTWVERWTYEGGVYDDAPMFPSKPYADVSEAGLALAVLSVLRKRGLLTIQALEMLASSSIHKPISIPPIRK